MKLCIEKELAELKQGNPVRVHVPELGKDVVLLLADERESIEHVLSECLDDVREQKGFEKAAFDSMKGSLKED